MSKELHFDYCVNYVESLNEKDLNDFLNYNEPKNTENDTGHNK